ncbi:MAG TPA: 3-methyl-2-oxobutanoate hydroxymethyltransferase [Methylibium sp.]|uniref:3-methyl-2-oxobutanoate hydroxymethyltransferase n=1 Tax=Methylibium sp. TaxID=2067992 RepID=UPI002DBBDAAD|nr:3-methyl-2-oxobutanoate hydroxymethyltransferase [Methylibium sp.]HEU4459842.1 3-methyl-2-oxobutanoate hydroxymethyltransferase [Methylibium sp.]
MSSQQSPAQAGAGTPARKAITLHHLREMHARGEKIAVITAYDASFAALVDAAGVDAILVGDSLGMVLKGQPSTLSVTMEQIGYHTRSTSRGVKGAFLIADMPFGSYQENPVQALRNAGTLMAAGAQMVKIEGGGWTPETVRFLVERGVPVCAHLGLTPQSVHALGGYRIQGKDAAGAETLRQHAKALADAGAAMMVLELMPSAVAAQVQADNPQLMTIGIGAGPGTAGQVLVLHDMLGVTRGRLPRFVRNFMEGAASIEDAVARYVKAVKDGSFPDPALHAY